MSVTSKHNGFSLAEVLLAVCTLAIGMSFVGGTFLVAIHLSTVATERTIAAVVADEAFAKIHLYANKTIVNSNDPNLLESVPNYDINSVPTVSCKPINDVFDANIPDYKFGDVNDEFAYPSTKTLYDKQYYWSALCRKTEGRLVQVTVFVSRKIGNSLYPGVTKQVPVPVPVPVGILGTVGDLSLQIEAGKENYINDGYTIVSNLTGRLYRVLKRDPDAPNMIVIDKPWQESNGIVWVVPPPVGGGRYPCIAIYQQIIRF